jgi:enoyl-CoA hydratase
MMSPQEAVTAGFLDKVVSEEEFIPMTSAIAQAMTKLDMKSHYQTKLKARAELLTILDQSIIRDQSSSL